MHTSYPYLINSLHENIILLFLKFPACKHHIFTYQILCMHTTRPYFPNFLHEKIISLFLKFPACPYCPNSLHEKTISLFLKFFACKRHILISDFPCMQILYPYSLNFINPHGGHNVKHLIHRS